ncbi:hypothetical protein BGP75_05800 [Motiliproteus sp. MSK22-1]|nr:hypothetical protein BGP75_05800 [Motiliproteus sp. MSK22-1]
MLTFKPVRLDNKHAISRQRKEPPTQQQSESAAKSQTKLDLKAHKKDRQGLPDIGMFYNTEHIVILKKRPAYMPAVLQIIQENIQTLNLN